MKHLLSKSLKTGDLIGIAYTNIIWLAFYCDSPNGNHFWDSWGIVHADKKVKEGLSKHFNPRKGYINTNADKRIVKINFEDVDPSHNQYSDIKTAIDILRERKIITY